MNSTSFLLDTNVISELMRKEPDLKVLEWFEMNDQQVFFISTVTKAELLLGAYLLPDGKRKMLLTSAVEKIFSEDFPGQCLPFDEKCCDLYAKIVASRTRTGRPVSTEDAQIAAIALSNNMTLATRNIRDFDDIENLTVANPWG